MVTISNCCGVAIALGRCTSCKEGCDECDIVEQDGEMFTLGDSIMFPGTQTWTHLSCGKEKKCCDCEEAVFPSLS